MSNCRHDAVPLPEEQEFISSSKCISKKVVTAEQAVLKPSQQNWVPVKSEAAGLLFIESDRRLFDNEICLPATRVHQVTYGAPFCILVANFGTSPITLKSGPIVSSVDEHPTNIVHSTISHAELRGIASEDTHYKNGKIDARIIERINKHLSD